MPAVLRTAGDRKRLWRRQREGSWTATLPSHSFMVCGVKKKILSIRPLKGIKLAPRSQRNGTQVSNL